jgi:hypothetical protein
MRELAVPILGLLLALGLVAPVSAEPYRPMLMFESPEAGDDHSTMSPYPMVGKATTTQRRNARQLMARLKRVAEERFPTLDTALRLGYREGARMRFVGQDLKVSNAVHSPFVHYNSRDYAQDGRVLDVRRPESLVYWRRPGGQPVLVGFMFRAPSHRRPPDPFRLGSIPFWHAHAVCDAKRKPHHPRQFETERCPTGLAHFGDNQMTHVWLADGLRAGYAMAVPARPLGIFIEGVPGLYEGSGESEMHPDHG